jgi:hypothetical protein
MMHCVLARRHWPMSRRKRSMADLGLRSKELCSILTWSSIVELCRLAREVRMIP